MKMKKSRILALLLALMMCLGLAACGEKTPPPPEDEGEASHVLNLGFIGPLTGPAALYGVSARNGAQIAVDEINEMDPDFKILFNPQDDEHDAEKAVNAYNTLMGASAQAIVGCVTTTPCNAVAAQAVVDRVFMLTPSASSPTVLEGRDNVYQMCFSDPNQGIISANFIKDNGLATKVGAIYNNSDAYSTGIYNAFKAAAAEIGLEIVSETTFTDDTANDFSVQLTDAKDKGAELIFIPIYYTPASLILNQAKAMNYDAKFFGCDGLDGILDMTGFDKSLAEGMLLLTPFAANAEDERTQSFVTKYQAAYNEVPSQFAADGYDCVYAIYNAIKFAGVNPTDMTAQEMCELLIVTFSSEQFTMDGLTGEGMVWSASGEVSRDPKVYEIKDGAYAEIQQS